MLNSAEHEICFVYKSKNTDKILKLFMLISAEQAQLSWAWKVNFWYFYDQVKFHAVELSMKKVNFGIFMTKWNFMLKLSMEKIL